MSNSCKEFKPFETPISRTPREKYLAGLENSGLSESRLVREWQAAGERALNDSLMLEMPFRETWYFRPEQPQAAGYSFRLKAGELLRLRLEEKPANVRLFVDLLRLEFTDTSQQYKAVFSPKEDQIDSLDYEIRQTGTYIVRIQPELLAAGRVTLELTTQPVYGYFPVSGKRNPDIWSFFGDERAGGRRRHEGIDIFAPRGTPLLAVTGGLVSTVRDTGLGGKQVWLIDLARRQFIYYAHLDTTLVEVGQTVKPGDTIGTVGNTGNARTTRPHLHFGIYRGDEGAIDPQPFVAYQEKQAPLVTADTSVLGAWMRVRASGAVLQAAPSVRPRRPLRAALPVQVLGASKHWYRVQTPMGAAGYVEVGRLEAADRPIRPLVLQENRELRAYPHPDAVPIAPVFPGEKAVVVGETLQFQLIRNAGGAIGWLEKTQR